MALAQQRDQRALADPGRTGDHEDLGVACASFTNGSLEAAEARSRLRGRCPSGGVTGGAARRRARRAGARRGRSTVLLGEMRQRCRTLVTFTRPYRGTASMMSATFAECTHSGGSSRTVSMRIRPAFRSRFRQARSVRTALASFRASSRCDGERSGVAARASASAAGRPSKSTRSSQVPRCFATALVAACGDSVAAAAWRQ